MRVSCWLYELQRSNSFREQKRDKPPTHTERRCAFEIRTLQRLGSRGGSATERHSRYEPSGSGCFHLLWTRTRGRTTNSWQTIKTDLLRIIQWGLRYRKQCRDHVRAAGVRGQRSEVLREEAVKCFLRFSSWRFLNHTLIVLLQHAEHWSCTTEEKQWLMEILHKRHASDAHVTSGVTHLRWHDYVWSVCECGGRLWPAPRPQK